MQNWFARHPYTITSGVFLGLLLFGWRGLGWGERQIGFALLLYLLVTLGVRLDEISRSLGGKLGRTAGDRDAIAVQLREIRALLQRIEAKLPPTKREE
jgi:hypothetical protein